MALADYPDQNVLIRWSGARLPLPDLSESGGRAFEIVGTAALMAMEITEAPGTTHAAATIYHYAVVQVSATGQVGALPAGEAATRVYDAAGLLIGALPNAPGQVEARLLPGRRPWVLWFYSANREQTPPANFQVFACEEGGAFNWSAPVASVAYRRGQTRYEWTGAALTDGAAWYYTVRARSAAGVLSLIPRMGQCPSGVYDAVDLGRVPLLRAPSGAPAAVAELHAEAVL